MHRGWLKLWRRHLDSPIWDQPPLYLKVWHWLLLRADYQTGAVSTTLAQLADAVQWHEHGQPRLPSRKLLLTILDWLQANHMIRREIQGQGNTKYTKVTLVNWATYQDSEVAPGNTNAPQTELSSRSTKNYKEGTDLRAYAREEATGPTPELCALAQDLVEEWNTLFPHTVAGANQLLDQNALLQLLTVHERTPAQIRAYLRYLHDHDKVRFWPRPLKLIRHLDQGNGPYVFAYLDMEIEALTKPKSVAEYDRSAHAPSLSLARDAAPDYEQELTILYPKLRSPA